MAIFTKPKLLFLSLLVLSLFLASQCDDQNPRGQDPRRELESCLRQCQAQGKLPEQQLQCQRSCVLRYERQQKGRECQQRCQQEYQREKEQQHRGQEETRDENQGRGKHDPEERLQECQQRCQREEQGQQQRQCQQRCQQEYRREQEQQHHDQETGEEELTPQREKEEDENPYLFKSHRFTSPFRASQGDLRVLEKFTQRSDLLRGIEKFRVAVVEVEPQSFMVPHHCDGEAIFVIVRGQGIISIAEQEEKNSFNLKHGDVMRVPAGSTIYLLNRDNNEKFFITCWPSPSMPLAKSRHTLVRGEKIQNPSTEHSALTSWRQLSMDNNQATEEQIRAISEHASRSTKQTKGEIRSPFNLLKERPLFESRFGQFFEASPERFEQLRDLDTAVGFMNINQGGMVLPYYNTRSTRLVMVVEGNGRFEMACPHFGSQRQGQGSREGRSGQEEKEQEGNVHYQKVRGTLNAGDVLVIPASHPITFIATGGSNLRIVGFGINAHNNKKNFLAGKQNIWKNIEREAKELSFNMPGREIEEIFQKQDQSFFVAGPEQQQRERGEQQYVSSFLDFVF
ncbi:hypothetical protein HAX54_051373 [Datura stramonium]|uniref:Cupin type-1 domain-containing protein n=1 Tax=Datura stramonium TaxID=4076 RepID=A0ABS8WS49_DATST|nr:hypothetical protein [Datura stramonium]